MTNATTEKALEVSAKVLHWLKTATKEEIEDKMAEFDGFYSFNIAKEFTNTPGGRLREHGKFSGEELRDDFILPLVLRARSKGMTLRIILDGGYGYAASFLEEVFGGMARKIGSSVVRETISLITEEQPELHSEILNFINNCQLENDCEVATEEVSVVFLVVRKCQSNFQITNVIGVFHNSTLAHECVDRMHELDEQYEDDFDNHLYNNGYIGSYEVLTIEVITSKAQFEEALDFQAEEK